MATRKAYIHNWKEYPRETHTHYEVEFDHGPDRAASWETFDAANRFCRNILEGEAIKIPAFDDRLCQNFRVEERAPYEFVILCDYPA
jgi:hypothetical protein